MNSLHVLRLHCNFRLTDRDIALLLMQKVSLIRKVQLGKNRFMKYETELSAPSCSPVLPHFPRVPTRIVEEVTFNTAEL